MKKQSVVTLTILVLASYYLYKRYRDAAATKQLVQSTWSDLGVNV